jgi:hypothetical protein
MTRLWSRRGSAGQAMAEFALVAPLFFLMLFAIVEGGRFIFYYELLNNATRDGARYAIVHGSNADPSSGPPAPDTTSDDPAGDNVIQATRQSALSLASGGALSAAPPAWWDCASTPPNPGDSSTGNNGRGQCVTVFVEYTYSTILPVLPPITISVESTLVVNN